MDSTAATRAPAVQSYLASRTEMVDGPSASPGCKYLELLYHAAGLEGARRNPAVLAGDAVDVEVAGEVKDSAAVAEEPLSHEEVLETGDIAG